MNGCVTVAHAHRAQLLNEYEGEEVSQTCPGHRGRRVEVICIIETDVRLQVYGMLALASGR